jgi:2,4-dienoyl-CoA reductase-like NADH-dependent reductase (Old Yellow Enzyme family)
LGDLIAFGRKFIANPDLPVRLRIGAPLNVDDPTTDYGGGERDTRIISRWNRTAATSQEPVSISAEVTFTGATP